MPKRSLNPGSGGQQKEDRATQPGSSRRCWRGTDGSVTKAAAEIEPLVRIAADLRNLPNASFKARLKSELGGESVCPPLPSP